MTVTVERKQKAMTKSRSKVARTTLWLIQVISVVLFVIMAVSVCLIHDSEPITPIGVQKYNCKNSSMMEVN